MAAAAAAASAAPPPPLTLIVRKKDTVSLLDPENPKPTKDWDCSEFPCVSSHDGSKVAIPAPEEVTVIQTKPDGKKPLYTLAEKNVKRIVFSPCDTYIMTWRSRVKEDDQTGGNVAIFDAGTGEVVRRFNQKNLDRWPTLKWSRDEKVAVQMVSNQLWLYTDEDITRFVKKIDQTKVSQFEIAPSGKYVCAGSPEVNSKPGVLAIYTLPEFKSTASRSLFKCEEFDLKWDSNGKYLLAQASVVSDTSGDSYYGETHQYLMHADGSFTQQLIFQNKGPISDTQWSPDGKSFVVIQGHQPALASLYLPEKCVKKFEFGRASWNTIRWSPHGRFLLLGGFGALQGQMHFWDTYKKKKVGVAQDREGPKYFDWAPDSRRFVTATTRPLRTVDNGYKIWSYAGELKTKVVIDHLYQASYVSALKGTYENKPQSPRLKGRKFQDFAAVPAPKAYIPPSLRGRMGGGSLSAQLRKERAVSGPTKVHSVKTGGKNVEKNRKKRERRRKKAAETSAGGGSAEQSKPAPKPKNVEKEAAGEKKKEEQKDEKKTESKPEEISEEKKLAKKVKSLKKKLKQIAQLEGKDPGFLNQDQKNKISSKSKIQAELAETERSLAALS